MSHGYVSIGWNRQKKIYDALILTGIIVYLGLFIGAGSVVHPNATIETLLIRGFGTCALLMLHIILSIGPLCRLFPRLLPLLYNRRHFGVMMFLMALAHGGFSLVQFHTLGDLNPLVSVLVSNERYQSLASFPFQPLGLAALLILFLMAATSHDFWLANLTAPAWKRLHMLVYVAYGLIVAHVMLGVLQAENNWILAATLAMGMIVVLGLHLIAGWRERKKDQASDSMVSANVFVDVCGIDEIENNRAKVVTLSGERVAIFKYDDKISAISNVCQHQNGPLGEGRIIDGCVTCPWHGFQYLPETGASPPPFTEKVPTFNVKVLSGRVLVDPIPNPPGKRVEPAIISETKSESANVARPSEFYIGYLPVAPSSIASAIRKAIMVMFAIVAVVALALVFGQHRFAESVFEFGTTREFEGQLIEKPFPRLLVNTGKQKDNALPFASYALVAGGKHGAEKEAAGFDGRSVKLKGTLIHRDGMAMIEIAAGSISTTDAAPIITSPGSQFAPATYTLAGEIVDSKCYLGVMNPGHTKPHRECASLCIRGGIPPLFVVHDARGYEINLWLVSETGEPVNQQVLDFVAEPVEITGQITTIGNQLFFNASPANYKRLQ